MSSSSHREWCWTSDDRLMKHGTPNNVDGYKWRNNDARTPPPPTKNLRREARSRGDNTKLEEQIQAEGTNTSQNQRGLGNNRVCSKQTPRADNRPGGQTQTGMQPRQTPHRVGKPRQSSKPRTQSKQNKMVDSHHFVRPAGPLPQGLRRKWTLRHLIRRGE